MYSVDLYARVRRACHVDGLSKSATGRLFGIDRKTVTKILTHSVPPRISEDGCSGAPEAGRFHRDHRSDP